MASPVIPEERPRTNGVSLSNPLKSRPTPPRTNASLPPLPTLPSSAQSSQHSQLSMPRRQPPPAPPKSTSESSSPHFTSQRIPRSNTSSSHGTMDSTETTRMKKSAPSSLVASSDGSSNESVPVRRTGMSSNLNGGGSQSRFNSPPPPPPRDVPLPPLPALPPISRSGSAVSGVSSSQRSLTRNISNDSMSMLNNAGKSDMASLGRGRAPIALGEEIPVQARQVSAPSHLENHPTQRKLDMSSNAQPQSTVDPRLRSNSSAMKVMSRPEQADNMARNPPAVAKPESAPLTDAPIRSASMQRSRTPEPIGKVSLAPEAGNDGVNSYQQRSGSLDMNRQQQQAESSRQAQLRGLGVASNAPPAAAARTASQSESVDSRDQTPGEARGQQLPVPRARTSSDHGRSSPLLPGQSPNPNPNGSWPSTGREGGKKWSMSPLVQLMEDSSTRRQEQGSLTGRRSEDLLNRTNNRSMSPEVVTKPPSNSRKISGGLRNLFTRNKKDKVDKPKAPSPVPPAPNDFGPRPLGAPIAPRRRASEDLLRTKRQQQEVQQGAFSQQPSARKAETPDLGMFTRRVTEPLNQKPIAGRDTSDHNRRDLMPDALANSGNGSGYAQRTYPPNRPPNNLARSHSDDSNDTETGPTGSNQTTPTFKDTRTVPPLLSLPLPDLPTIDFNLGSTLDTMFQKFDSKGVGAVSPLESGLGSMSSVSLSQRPPNPHRRSRSFSEFSKPPSIPSSSQLPSADSNASLVAALAAYSKLETMRERQSSGDRSSDPLSVSEHGRTLSTTSSQNIETSPPRTPGSTETAQVTIAGSISSGSVDGMHTSQSDESAELAVVGRAWMNNQPPTADKSQKAARPRLLQLADASGPGPATIVEQDEGGSETTATTPAAATHHPDQLPVNVSAPNSSAQSKPALGPAMETPKSTKVEIARPPVPQVTNKVRRIPIRRRSQIVNSSMSKSALADNMKRILNL